MMPADVPDVDDDQVHIIIVRVTRYLIPDMVQILLMVLYGGGFFYLRVQIHFMPWWLAS